MFTFRKPLELINFKTFIIAIICDIAFVQGKSHVLNNSN